jgi:hypothetical protein
MVSLFRLLICLSFFACTYRVYLQFILQILIIQQTKALLGVLTVVSKESLPCAYIFCNMQADSGATVQAPLRAPDPPQNEHVSIC